MKAHASAIGLLVILSLCALSGGEERLSAAATDLKVTPGDFIVDHPTLINLGFEWVIDGDANRNATVAVSYRKQGDAGWKQGMPLMRLHGERIFQQGVWNVVSPNMFAGSILDLESDTAYEARFVMSDPDGIAGRSASATKTVVVRTRPEPQPAAGGSVYHVYPNSYKGERLQPAFSGLMCAYNYRCGAGDTAPTGRPRVKPGDTILMHAGVYAYHYELYANDTAVNATTPYEGTYYLFASGTPAKPIVIRAAGDGEVVLDGRGAFNLVNVKGANYNYFEGITFRNTNIAIWAGTEFLGGSKGLTVKRCRFEDVGLGVFSNYSGSSDFYIADSTFIGRDDPKHLIGWTGEFWKQFDGVEGQTYPPVMASYTAVRLYGPGHVVAYNYVANFHDGIDIETYGNPDGSHAIEGPSYPAREYWERRPTAIDFYNNYMTNFHDNAFEADGGLHNIRVMRNMMLNSASHPMSNQPSVGGPVYWIRNIAYHAPGGSTRMTSGSPGVLFYNNTILTETFAASSANSHWRNNLFLGENSAPAIFNVSTNTNYSSSDYNGFRPNPGATPAFQWNSPPWSVAADYAGLLGEGANTARGAAQGRGATAGRSSNAGTESGRGAAAAPRGDADPVNRALETRRFVSFADYVRETKQDRHSVLLDYDIFVNVPRLDAKDIKKVQQLYNAEDLDFRLKPGSAAVDKGVVVPNITDGFTGVAPDLGALEVGQALPIYGPRPVSK